MRSTYRLAGQFGIRTAIALAIGLLAAFVGEWTVGISAEERLLMIPPAHRPAFFILAFAGLLMLMTIALLTGAVLEGMLGNGHQRAKPTVGPSDQP